MRFCKVLDLQASRSQRHKQDTLLSSRLHGNDKQIFFTHKKAVFLFYNYHYNELKFSDTLNFHSLADSLYNICRSALDIRPYYDCSERTVFTRLFVHGDFIERPL